MKPVTKEGTLLMDSLVLGLTEIENSYSKRYLKVKVREVQRHDENEPSVIRT